MDIKGQQIKNEKDRGKIFLSVAEIMLNMIALIFQGIKGLIFNFPSGTSAFDQRADIVFGYHNIGHPAIAVGDLVIFDNLILIKIS